MTSFGPIIYLSLPDHLKRHYVQFSSVQFSVKVQFQLCHVLHVYAGVSNSIGLTRWTSVLCQLCGVFRVRRCIQRLRACQNPGGGFGGGPGQVYLCSMITPFTTWSRERLGAHHRALFFGSHATWCVAGSTWVASHGVSLDHITLYM